MKRHKIIITYIDPKTLEEKVQKLILNIKSEWINPFEETIRCQAITKKGTQCSTSRKIKLWIELISCSF
jgi:hypothetical protein